MTTPLLFAPHTMEGPGGVAECPGSLLAHDPARTVFRPSRTDLDICPACGRASFLDDRESLLTLLRQDRERLAREVARVDRLLARIGEEAP